MTYIRLSDAVEQYLAQRFANCAPATASNDASVLRRFAKSTGDIQVRHLTPRHVDQWFYGEKGLRLTLTENSSFNNYRKRLNSFMRYCAQRAWLRTDPMVNVRARKIMNRERLRLAATEMTAMLDLTENPRDRVYLAININTGLRASEIVSLRVGDVDLAAGDLHVTILKTAEEDTMPITSDLDKELRTWFTRYSKDLDQPLDPTMYLVPSATGPRYQYATNDLGNRVRSIRPGNWQPHKPLSKPAEVVQTVLRRMQIPTKGEGSHTLRRSVARVYFDMESEAGYDSALRATSSLLHHKDTATTEAYLGMSKERKRRDETLRGKPFLSALAADGDNVVVLRKSQQ